MTLAGPTLLSLARALVVVALTLAPMLAGGPGIRALRGDMRRLLFWGAMAALLVPGFVTGFVLFENRDRIEVPLESEWRYVLLVWARYASLALLAVWLAPPSLSGEAMHARRLAAPQSAWRHIAWELRAWGRGLWLGAGLVFLLAFQEFELAATWNMRAWTVALFDAQTGGLALGETLRLATLPLLIQAALGAALFAGMRSVGMSPATPEKLPRRALIGMLPAFAALTLGVAVPLLMFLANTRAITTADEPGSLIQWREIGSGAVLSVCATLGAWVMASWIGRRRGWSVWLAIPGLLGALPCGLLFLALLQIPPLQFLRDTALPAIAALAFVLLPFALILRAGIRLTRDTAALHIARSSGARRPLWHASGWPRTCALLLLFCFGCGDFTVNGLLAPPAFTSAGVRLLNLLHYGRSEALSAMFALTFAVPLGAAVLTALAARFYPRRRVC